MARVNARKSRFTVTDNDQGVWANGVDFPTLRHLLGYLRKANDTSRFEVWVIQDGIVTHIVPYERMCEYVGA